MGVAFRRKEPSILMSSKSAEGVSLRGQLDRAGFRVSDLPSDQVLNAFLSQRPELLLLELDHNGQLGSDLAHRVRDTEHGSAVPIYCFGSGRQPNPAEVVSMGADLCFPLPVEIEWLLSKLSYLLPPPASKEKTASSPMEADIPDRAEEERKKASRNVDPLQQALDLASELMLRRSESSLSSSLEKVDGSDSPSSSPADLMDSITSLGLSGPESHDLSTENLMPSLTDIIPKNVSAPEATADIDLNAADIPPTVGEEVSGLVEMANPMAGVIGLDAPVDDPEPHDTQWSVETGTGNRSPTDMPDSDTFQMSESFIVPPPSGQGSPDGTGPVNLEDRRSGQPHERPSSVPESTEVINPPPLSGDRDTAVMVKLRDDKPTPQELPRVSVVEPKKSKHTDSSSPKSDPDLPLYDPSLSLPESGLLQKTSAVELIAMLSTARFTGSLQMERTEGRIALMMRKGRLVFATTEGTGLTLPDMLLKSSRITPSQLDRAVEMASENKRRVASVLVDLGYLSPRELLPTVRSHVASLFYEACGWTDGTFEIHHSETAAAEAIEMETRLAALMLEGLKRKYPRNRIIAEAGGVDSSFVWVSDAREDLLAGVDLTPRDWRVIDLIASGCSLIKTASLAGCDIEDVARLAYLMRLLGLVTPAVDSPPADHRKQAPKLRKASKSALEMMAVKTDAKAHRERIESKLKEVDEGDYFTLLGVAVDATIYEIRQAYTEIKRNFSPAILPDVLATEMSEPLALINRMLDEALDVLTDEQYAERYRAAHKAQKEEYPDLRW